MRIGSRALIRSALGIGISVIAAYLVLRSVDLAAAADVLRSASPAWIGVMVVATITDVAFRALRWQALLAPIVAVPYRRVLGYTYLGYLANSVLPARLGSSCASTPSGRARASAVRRSWARSSWSG